MQMLDLLEAPKMVLVEDYISNSNFAKSHFKILISIQFGSLKIHPQDSLPHPPLHIQKLNLLH